MSSAVAPPPVADRAGRLASTLSDLIRIDTTNLGEGDSRGERAAAEYAAARLASAGLEPLVVEPSPRRANLVTRWPGLDTARPPLVVHGHLDVVPADASEWTRDPFGGEVADGFVWGRGAIDMKHFVAQLLCLVEQRRAEQRPPARDVLLVFTADEEDSGEQGAFHLVRQRPELFDGAVDAIGEGGGLSVSLPSGRRLYPVSTGEKGLLWTRVTAHGRAGHGSMVNDENAVTRLSQALAAVGSASFESSLGQTTRHQVAVLAEELGVDLRVAVRDLDALAAMLPMHADELRASVRGIVTPTVVDGGYKANVVPGAASAVLDIRTLPGQHEELIARVDELLGPSVTRETLVEDRPFEVPVDGRVPAAIAAALAAEDPDGRPCPWLDVGGTDAKAFSELGIDCYGFTPIRFPADEPHPLLFHGVDERVPVDGLALGLRVLDRVFDAI